MAEMAKAHGIRVYLVSMLPAKEFWWARQYKPAAKLVEHNAWLKRYAAYNGFTYIDYYSAMANDDGGMRSGLTDDGVHPNLAGYAVMAPVLSRSLVATDGTTNRPKKPKR